MPWGGIRDLPTQHPTSTTTYTCCVRCDDCLSSTTPPCDDVTVSIIGASPPSCATYTSPSNGATGVLTSAKIDWNSATGATGYKVYFGTSSSPPLVADVSPSTTSYSPSMSSGTTYYWKIVPYNGAGPASGCSTYHFTTETGGGCDCHATVSTFPYTEGFESGLIDWENRTGDDIDWTRKSGSTSSSSTGPSSAHGGSYYIYTESSGHYYDEANIYGPCFNFSSVSSPEIVFWYHMYGSSMGQLYLEASNSVCSSWTTVWTKSGDQGNSWYEATVDLSSYGSVSKVQLRFRGVTGSNYRSDMAVDDITVQNGGGGPGGTFVWTGSSSTDWDDGSNWMTLGGTIPDPHILSVIAFPIPTASDFVLIPELLLVGSVWPTKTGHLIIGGELGDCAALVMEGKSRLTVTEDWTKNSAGEFKCREGTVIFGGSENSQITGATTFYELEVNKTSNSYYVKPAASTTLHITNLDVSHSGVFDATKTGLNIWMPAEPE